MGEVLENGLYLPDEGERNCYAGLESNWNALDNLIDRVDALSSAGLKREIVTDLPTTDIQTNVIYMLRNSETSGNLYDEYMYINDAWEPVGQTQTDMSNYYTKTETDALPAVSSGITASRVTNYDNHIANTDVHVTLANKSTWNNKQNALDTDQLSAVNSGVTANKVTAYDDHIADTAIHVTANDKTTWNSKQDGLSSTQLSAVNSGATATKITAYDTHVNDTDIHVSTVDRANWNGKQDALSASDIANIATIPNKANSADLATVATTGSYNDLLNQPTIPTVNNATITIQKNGTDVDNFTLNQTANKAINLAIPVNTSDLNNDSGFLTEHNPVDDELSVSSENSVQNKVITTALNGKADSSHTHSASEITSGTFGIARIPNLDASKITSGVLDLARIPNGALERVVKVADETARYALTTDDVQLGDTVQQLDTMVMYAVTDVDNLDNANGYTEYTAGSATSVPWSGVTGKPSTYTPSSHTHGNIQNDGTLSDTSKVVVTDNSQKITTSSITATELDYLSGVTSNIQTQIDTKANSSSLATVATSGSYNDLLNTPTIPTVNNATLTIQKNGTDVSSFTANASANVTANITVPTKTSDLSNDSGYITGVAWDDVTNKPSTYTPSSHTHGNITNAGAIGSTSGLPIITGTDGVLTTGTFGSTEGTFCEGNDSRLSDARTPVAHTHVTADVTDLLSGDHTWTGDNTFSGTLTGTLTGLASQATSDADGNVITDTYATITALSTLSDTVDTKADDSDVVHIADEETITGAKTFSNTLTSADVVPSATDTYSLGSASYQYNAVYGATYYYNGVQWGLDQANVWTAYQTIYRSKGTFLTFTCPDLDGTVNATGNWASYIQFNSVDNGTATFRSAFGLRQLSGGTNFVTLLQQGSYSIYFGAKSNSDNSPAFYPVSNGTIEHGTSSNKWKTIWTNSFNSVPTDTVEWHNSHYRGENLISSDHFSDMAALLTAIRAQDWSDIYIGDYVELTFTYESASRTVKFYVGEIDKFYKVGNSSLTTHHLVMVTGDLGINQVMNDTNTTAGGYVGSQAHTTTLPALYEIINPLFNNAILTHREHLSNTVTSTQSVSLTLNDTAYTCSNFPIFSSGDPNATGIVTAGAWYDCNLVLMSEIEMFGSNRFSSSGIDDIMCPEGQIAAFKYNRNLQTLNRTINTWLRNVNSASRFCYCYHRGSSYRNTATYTNLRLRPRFLIG